MKRFVQAEDRTQGVLLPEHLTKTIDRVSTEMSLHVLAYNLKRVMKIVGVGALMEAIQA
jgi:hypothetical protein